MRATTTFILTVVWAAAIHANTISICPDNPIVKTEKWGNVDSKSLSVFHQAYALFSSKAFHKASEKFKGLLANKNYNLADEAKWYYAESLLLANEELETAMRLYLSMAYDEKSAWAGVSKDKLSLPQMKRCLLKR